MKYILTQDTGRIFGPFNSIEKIDDGYLCNNAIYPNNELGNVSLSEVEDDYINTFEQTNAIQIEIDVYNANIKKDRAKAYNLESDPLFFKAQRDEATLDDWKAKVDEIKARYPYKEQV
jgi:hypothetical protein